LQALRHLYVLAVEPRLLLPRDIDSRTLCYANVTYVFLNTSVCKEKTVKITAPCLLPELHLLKEVSIFMITLLFCLVIIVRVVNL